jgi:endonuclease/exonuclease/phosphatase (EEP) superfamily protein YafD
MVSFLFIVVTLLLFNAVWILHLTYGYGSVMGVTSWGRGRFVIPPSDDVLRVLRRDGQGTKQSLEKRVSVLVWNIQKEQDSGFEDAFATLAQNRDLVLLQELHLSDGAEDIILAQRDAAYVMATSFIYRSDGSRSGVAIGSPVTPKSFEAQITPDKEPIVHTPKPSLIAEFRLPWEDQTLLVISVHGINRASFAAFQRQIDALVSRLQSHRGPLLLAGDFNTQSAKKTDYLLAAAARLSLTAVTFSPDDRTVSKLSRRPLDHAFVRGAFVENTACWVGGSDHAAMTFDLVLTDPSS